MTTTNRGRLMGLLLAAVLLIIWGEKAQAQAPNPFGTTQTGETCPTGCKGEKGDPGPAGPAGPQGPAGPAGPAAQA